MTSRSLFLLAAATMVADIVAVAAEPVPPCQPEDAALVRIDKVTDGQTVVLADGRVVRLAGIQGPPPGDAAATAARQRLVELAAGEALLVSDGKEDRYGRLPGHIFMQEEEAASYVQLALVAEGHARVRRPEVSDPCRRALYEAEDAAIRAKIGLWARPELGVQRADDPSLAARNGVYEIVEGLVLSVGGRTYMTFLDFGPDYRTDFTVMIPPSLAEKLAGAGTPAETFKGRRVRVRGVVEISNGPAIRLKRVDEIALIDGEDVSPKAAAHGQSAR